MPRLLALLFSFLVCCSPSQHPVRAPTVTVNNPAEPLRAATVALLSVSKGGDHEYVSCSGVWISETELITALHCVEDENIVLFLNYSDLGTDSDPEYLPHVRRLGVVIKKDEGSDLAELVAVGQVGDHGVAVLAKDEPVTGDRLRIVGHPAGLPFTYSESIVSGVRHFDDVYGVPRRVLQINGGIWFGNSGGGAYNDAGALVGIASFMETGPRAGFLTSVPEIRHFLQPCSGSECPAP